jgi:O-antigen/teichoic acid export membrane protein
MLLTMLISLYTSRVILNTLGIVDFGIYNVVGGIVAIFSLLSGSLSASVSRFITFELGKGNIEQLKKVFSTSVSIHIALSIIILLLAESIGVWFLNAKMNIPYNRIYAANWVLQFSILTFLINIISVPYNAAIIAHEHMKAFAYVSIIEVTLKLLVVLILVTIPFDKLIIYALMLVCVALIIRIIYGIYCKKHFEECSFYFTYDKQLFKEMTGFAGWNFIGASSAILRDHGVNILLNIFSGPTVNAARGIAVQVNTAIGSFTTNFMTAINPQITKSYASKDRDYMMTLIYQGARFSFYLLLLLSLPVLIETKQILTLWLKVVPDHTVNFVRLIMIFTLMESLSGTLITAMLATGKIRNYQILVGGVQMMNFPISYLFLKLGLMPEITFMVAILISILCLMARLWMLKGMIGISLRYYLKHVLFNVITVSIVSIIIPSIIYYSYGPSVYRLLLIAFIGSITTLISIYFIGCNTIERNFINSKVVLIKNMLLRR